MMFPIPDDSQIPDCKCIWCGFVGKPYQFKHVYELVDPVKRLRKLHVRCPKCKVLDTISHEDNNSGL